MSKGSPQVLVGSLLRRARPVQTAWERLGRRVIAAAGEPEAQLSLLLVGDRRMRRLNHLYRGRNSPTDVLAFPIREGLLRLAPHVPRPAPELLGDVVISLRQAARQAKNAGHSLDHELATLFIHGTLHLLGYDHERGRREAERMQRKERAILQAVEPVPRLFREHSAVSRQRSARNPRLKADR
jgi:rRNA maturation RNase YbeY